MTATDLWYVSRGTGLVLYATLGAAVALGLLVRAGWGGGPFPRFVILGLHRSLALFAVVLAGVHVGTAELDPYVHLGWLSIVVPFVTPYRPLWMGLGTVGAELLAAVVATSAVRPLVGARSWRVVHGLVLVAWPCTLAHVVGMGPDVAIPAVAAEVAVGGAVGLIALVVRLGGPAAVPAPVGAGAIRRRR